MSIEDLRKAFQASTQGEWDGEEESGNPEESFVIQASNKVIAWIADTLPECEDMSVISAEDEANRDFIVKAHGIMSKLLALHDAVQSIVKSDGDLVTLDLGPICAAMDALRGDDA